MAGRRRAKREITSYRHRGEERVNNPPVGLVTGATDPDSGKRTYEYDPHLDPQLVWAGKAEHTSFEVPTVSLHVHERIDPRSIIEAVRRRNSEDMRQTSLFEAPEENPPMRQALQFYQHQQGWTNRLIAGDSLLIMNSLLEKEGQGGQVQMIYIDPPYGISYGSNFQPFVNRRNVQDRRDFDLTSEPETISAFRDTWELGIHSYLSYLRDRLLLSRELLAESGSIFVQISDENVHHVRELMDEVFGVENFIVTFPVKKKGSQKSGLLDPVNDFLIWYGRSPRETGKVKYRQLYHRRPVESQDGFRFVEIDGNEFSLASLKAPNGKSFDYRSNPERVTVDHPRARFYRPDPLQSGGVRRNQSLPFEYQGKTYTPSSGSCWKTTVRTDDGSIPGMERLKNSGRLVAVGKGLYYRRYFSDFEYKELSNWWDNLGGASNMVYVVQTNEEIIKRCILMTTDPGDLVLDPTCGSGTTAVVAEQWGRRWITCDTSRVAVTLARQRLMTSLFDWYLLGHPDEGVGSGFRYKTAPHITLGSIANNPDIGEGMSSAKTDAAIRRHAPEETLYDQPLRDAGKRRVTGPFTVEAVPAATVQSLDEVADEIDDAGTAAGTNGESQSLTTSLARSGETARQSDWRDELLKTGIRGRAGLRMAFTRLEPQSGTHWIHAIGEADHAEAPQRVAVSFGPNHAPMEQRQIERAWEEARRLSPQPELLVFAAFQFDPEAAKDIDEMDPALAGVQFLKAQMNADLLTEDLKRKRSSNESFWLIGQPDVEVRRLVEDEDVGKWQVEVHGFDYFNTRTGGVESGGAGHIAVWMLDPDYDGRSLFPEQVFFPMAGARDGWARLARNLKAEIDTDLIEAYRGTLSLPFEAGEHGRAAVKIVDDRGIESLKVVDLQ